VRAIYTVRAGGTVHVAWHLDTRAALPARLAPGLHASLPRVGLSAALRLHTPLQRLAWYGAGPHECYADRKHGAAARRHASSVHGLHVPYVFPQESGGRADVRWAALGAAAPAAQGEGAGGSQLLPALALCVAGGSPPMQLNVSRFSMREYQRAAHDHELAADGLVHLHLDHLHMGVGGDDSWSPSVHQQYLVPPGQHSFEVLLAPGAGPERAAAMWRAAAAVAAAAAAAAAAEAPAC
jgi:beta-galactosidase